MSGWMNDGFAPHLFDLAVARRLGHAERLIVVLLLGPLEQILRIVQRLVQRLIALIQLHALGVVGDRGVVLLELQVGFGAQLERVQVVAAVEDFGARGHGGLQRRGAAVAC